MFLSWNSLKHPALKTYLKVNTNGILSLWMLQSFNWFCHGYVQLISNRKASV